MRKTAQKAKENASENQEVSPPKKAKLRENRTAKEGTQVVASNRLPRAAKNRAVALANNNVETTKPRARAKATTLRRSNSSGDIATIATGKLKKTKSKSAEHLEQAEDPPAKKSKNVAVKPAKKTVPKKAGTGAKVNPKKKASKDSELEELDEEPEVPQIPFIAKKAYGRTATKKAAPVETKEDNKPKKRMPVKAATAAAPKATRGRGKQAIVDEAEEEAVVENAKPAKGRKGKANERNAAPESDEENLENVAEEVENAEDSGRAKRGKKAPVATKRPPRGKKVTVASESAGEPNEDDHSEIPPEEPEENKLSKGGKKGKAAAAVKNRGKSAGPLDEDNDLQDQGADNTVENAEESVGTPDKLQKLPEESAKSLKNGKADVIEANGDAGVFSP